MSGLGAKDILRNVTALEQLIEEINFQRAKEMRQCLLSKDSDTGFMIVHGATYWTDLFVRHFLFQTDRSTDADDLLFFIRKKHIRGSRHVHKYQTEVEVYRKDSRKLPIGDPDIDWEETVYLNLIIHQFDYTLTLAVCTRTSPKDLQVLRRHSQKVYASPSRRRMDTKGEVEEITYPNVCFHVDNFDEVFCDMQVRDGEMVCVELVAADHSGTRQAVIFLGSIRYDALKRVYDARASLSSKVAQRMMLGLFSSSSNQRIEFVRMKGPQSKGHAEMAVTKPKGSGVETPTSEPGVSLTDLWDCDWEDEPEDRLLYRHQRRLSDPSANFNTFINSGWRARGGVASGVGGHDGVGGGRSRSENEGLDCFADGLYEIESGDVRDGSSCTGRCCIVCGCKHHMQREPLHRERITEKVVEDSFRCNKCGHFHSSRPSAVGTAVTQPAEMAKSEAEEALEKPNTPALLAECAVAEGVPSPCTPPTATASVKCPSSFVFVSDADLEENVAAPSLLKCLHNAEDDSEEEKEPREFEPLLGGNGLPPATDSRHPTDQMAGTSSRLPDVTCVQPQRKFQDLPRTPCTEIIHNYSQSAQPKDEQQADVASPSSSLIETGQVELCGTDTPAYFRVKTRGIKMPGMAMRVSSSMNDALRAAHPLGQTAAPVPLSLRQNDKGKGCVDGVRVFYKDFPAEAGVVDGGSDSDVGVDAALEARTEGVTLGPLLKKKMQRRKITIPYRITLDGTRINFIGDIKLDDGAYNPLWSTRGFTQTFHFWKENRRAQSVPFNAYLTYVTLPWFHIITDILDHETGPILTF